MCYTHVLPESWYDYPQSPGPRAIPRLVWATPVDIVELGSSLEAYSDQLQANTTLRLCHRFGDGLLSKLPQEILDQIISVAHRMQKHKTRFKWKQHYLCFQGRCTGAHHFKPYGPLTEEAWHYLFVDEMSSNGKLIEKPSDYTEKQRLNILEDYLDHDDCGHLSEMIFDIHLDRSDSWLGQVCLCKEDTDPTRKEGIFTRFNNILKAHFGIEALLLHEVMSDNLTSFLPDAIGYSEISFYTSCFLGLSSPPSAANPQSQGRLASHRNTVYAGGNNHLAFHEVMDPAQINITTQQKRGFAKAMRILDLKPYYHLTELEALLNPDNDDEALWAICDGQILGCPKPSEAERPVKKRLLKEYLQTKSQDLSRHIWPQFMVMATSDAVGPTGSS